MKTATLIATALTASETADNASWFQTTPPYGEYPGGNIKGPDGKPVEGAVVRFDEASVRRVAAAFEERMRSGGWPGVLVDREHFSLDTDKPSDAMAWAVAVRVADDGSIWTRWDFTPKGRELWEGRILVSRSPVLRLERVGNGKVYVPAVSISAVLRPSHITSMRSDLSSISVISEEIMMMALPDLASWFISS